MIPPLTLKSMTGAGLKRHPALIPLLGFTVLGMGGAFAYLFRLATINPDVSWDKKNNQLPYLKKDPTWQYKFYSPLRDYSKETSPRPKY